MFPIRYLGFRVSVVMPIEIEAKAYAKNLKVIEEKIINIGAKLVWQGKQVDTYYNHPNRNFAETDEALRVREEEDKAVLTYKGPKIDTLTKTREEIKVQLKDTSSIKELLKRLGFKEVGVVKKHRMKFFLDEFKICLDKVEGLGEFVEIEAASHSKESNAKVTALRNRILKTFDQLGLKDMERRSYLELLLEKSR